MIERWCGGQHHFIGNCNYHLTTYVSGYLISTVGEYYPKSKPDRMATLGIAPDSFYETMVFPLPNGTVVEPFDGSCPVPIDWGGEIVREHYATHQDANRGHMSYVDRARNEEI